MSARHGIGTFTLAALVAASSLLLQASPRQARPAAKPAGDAQAAPPVTASQPDHRSRSGSTTTTPTSRSARRCGRCTPPTRS